MFGKKESRCYIPVDDGVLEMSQATYDYVTKLKNENRDLKREKSSLEAELRAIKPVVENKDWAPAISRDCGECKLVVRSRWDGSIIGCRKPCVCDDFVPVENESPQTTIGFYKE